MADQPASKTSTANKTSTATDHRTASQRGIRRTAIACVAGTAAMLGAAYAAVPLYNLFCKVTGYGRRRGEARNDAAGIAAVDAHAALDLELACAVVYLLPATAVLGAILLTGYIGGAICTHWRVGDLFFIQAALGLFVWLGIYLREERLKALLPVRRSWATK